MTKSHRFIREVRMKNQKKIKKRRKVELKGIFSFLVTFLHISRVPVNDLNVEYR